MDLIRFRGFLIVKSQLLNLTGMQIADKYDDSVETYSLMLERFGDLLDNEPDFIIVSGTAHKIYDAMSKRRFEYMKDSDMCERINAIIGKTNSIVGEYEINGDPIELYSNFWADQEDLHNLTFTDFNDLYRTLRKDPEVLDSIIFNRVEESDDVDFLGTVCYCLNYIPDAFKNDEFRGIVKSRLDKPILVEQHSDVGKVKTRNSVAREIDKIYRNK